MSSSFSQNNVPRNTNSEDMLEDQGDDGLAPSAAAGIGVGSTLGGIILLALVAFLIHRGRRNRTKLDDTEADAQHMKILRQKEAQLRARDTLKETK
ncbi:hypothetical protein K445DRAFT_323225 [Daldinia sp. EC12]|nr:hypothetical protein K445DRAFT_323225 [Daldinia sp. EC12]